MGKYQVELTLTRLAAIAISKHLWKYSHLRDVLQACIDSEDDDSGEPENVIKFVLIDVLESFLVPEAATEELHFAIGTMGRAIFDLFDWFQDLFVGLSADDELFTSQPSPYTDYICWTTHGCLDSSLMIRSLYLSNILLENYATWVLLCTHCIQDCIIDFWPKTETMDHCSDWLHRPINIRRVQFDSILLAYWTARMSNDVENAIDVVFRQLPDHFYDDAYTLEENMFMNSFVQNRYWAVKYFWGLFNENQRKRTIVEISKRIMSDDPNMQKYKDFFFTGHGPVGHLLIFFLQQLSQYNLDNVRIKILGSGFLLVELLEWPYDNLFFDTLRESLIHHDFIDFGPIFSRIFLNISECDKYQFLFGDVKYRRIFYRIWEMNPKNFKNSIDYHKGLQMLWESKNIDLIDYMLRDHELKDRREEFFNRIVEVYLWKPDNTLMQKFIRKALVSDEEREFFKCRIVPEFPDDSDEDMDTDF